MDIVQPGIKHQDCQVGVGPHFSYHEMEKLLSRIPTSFATTWTIAWAPHHRILKGKNTEVGLLISFSREIFDPRD